MFFSFCNIFSKNFDGKRISVDCLRVMWIIKNQETISNRLPVFCKRFEMEKPIRECVLRISALGIFSVKINGRQIDDYFMPGWTNYNKYVHLCTYDITADIQKENCIEVTLSDGWYAGRLGYTCKPCVYGSVLALFAELDCTFADGTGVQISTDESWKVGESHIITSSLLDGEHVDFRMKKTEYSKLPFAQRYACNLPFELYDYEPVKAFTTLKPTVIYQDENCIRLDFKQNFSGFITFDAVGEAGTEVILQHAEVLEEDGSLYYKNLRSVKATDRAVLSGGKDRFSPIFTFHGFRYAEIRIFGKAELSNLVGVALTQDLPYTGKFRCSDEIVNTVFKNVQWGQKDNFISIPTDCPQRDERLGWTGDAQVFCNTAMFNCNCNRFFANYLKLVRTDIQPDGKIPSFAPFFIPVSVSTAGVPGWADAICVIPYVHYLHYKDIRVIKDNLPAAVRHLDYYLANSEEYLLKVKNPFGDWLSVQKAEDVDGVSQAFFALSAQLVSKMFALVKDEKNAQKYAQIYEKIKAAFRLHYRTENGKLIGDSQTIYALALSVGLVSKEEVKPHLLAAVERAGNKLTTGFIGVRHLLPALCEIGATDLAYQIIKCKEYPSWGYTIENGATTVWERWNGYTKEHGFETPSMNSFNHYSLGSCVEWLYSYVLGIKLSATEKLCISPSLSKELAFAEGEYMTERGIIRVSWKYDKEAYHVRVESENGVEFDYDFAGREVISLQKEKNALTAIVR